MGCGRLQRDAMLLLLYPSALHPPRSALPMVQKRGDRVVSGKHSPMRAERGCLRAAECSVLEKWVLWFYGSMFPHQTRFDNLVLPRQSMSHPKE